MDEFTVGAFVNRDEPIPVVEVDASAPGSYADDDAPLHDEGDGPRAREGKRARLRAALKGGLHGKSPEAGPSMQDRLLEK